MAGELWLADSNILIRWVQPADLAYAIVRSAIQRLKKSGAVACYISQNLGEFWNAMTRPAARNGYGLSPFETDIRASAIETHFELLPDNPAIHLLWRRILIDHAVSGTQVHDARLVAAMTVHGVKRILTFNAETSRGIPALKPCIPHR
jgi:predicted nucleic acid-binding protein